MKVQLAWHKLAPHWEHFASVAYRPFVLCVWHHAQSAPALRLDYGATTIPCNPRVKLSQCRHGLSDLHKIVQQVIAEPGIEPESLKF